MSSVDASAARSWRTASLTPGPAECDNRHEHARRAGQPLTSTPRWSISRCCADQPSGHRASRSRGPVDQSATGCTGPSVKHEHGRPGTGDHGGHGRRRAARRPAPATRASPARGSPGAAGPRVARCSSSGRPASAATSSAARPAFAAASACGTCVGQQPPRDLGGDRVRRHEHHRGDPRVDGGVGRRTTRRRRARRSRTRRGTPAPRCRGGPRGPRPGRTPASSSISSPPPATSPRASAMPATIAAEDEPEAAAVRDHVAAGQAQPGRLARPWPRRPRRIARTTRCDSSRGTASAPSPCDLDGEAVGDHLRLELVAEVEGEPEGVEPGTEVGRGGRHRDLHRAVDEPGHQVSPAAAAAASDVGVHDVVDEVRRSPRARWRCP